jgi:hypothetical protein
MLNGGADRLAEALDELEAGDRALLDLSLRRGIRDEDLAELLKTDTTDVAQRRVDALERLAAEVGTNGPDHLPNVQTALVELPPESWSVALSTPAEPPPPPAPPPAEVGVRPRRLLYALLPILAVVAIVGILVAVGAYHGGSEDSAPPPAAPNAQTPRTPLASVGGGSTRGSAAISGEQLDLSVSGLRRGAHYEVWLYNSVADAVPIAPLRGPSGRAQARVPEDARQRFLDVSLEPADGNPNHSGQSVLRAPLAKLR